MWFVTCPDPCSHDPLSPHADVSVLSPSFVCVEHSAVRKALLVSYACYMSSTEIVLHGTHLQRLSIDELTHHTILH